MELEVIETAAYKRGYDTCGRLFGSKKNPYPEGSVEHAEWAAGFLEALYDNQW